LKETALEGVKIYTRKNPFHRPGHPEDLKYLYDVKAGSPVDLDVLSRYAEEMKYTTHDAATIKACMAAGLSAAIRLVSNNRPVRLGGFLNVIMRARGGANDPRTPFREGVGSGIYFLFTEGAALRKAVEHVPKTVLGPAPDATRITGFTDLSTGNRNGVMTPGKPARITGENIRILGDDTEAGVFLYPREGGIPPVKISGADIIRNTASEVIFMLPSGINGHYAVGVVTRYKCSGGSKRLRKTPAAVRFGADLTT
jgi:hypothetical protein